jgi:hypothetical protein
MVPKDLEPVLTIPKYQEVFPEIMGRLNDYLMSRSEVIGKIASMLNMESNIREVENDLESVDIESYPFDSDYVEDSFLHRFCEHWIEDPWRFKRLRNESWYIRDEAEKHLSKIHTLRMDLGRFGDKVTKDEETLSRRKESSKNLFEWFLAAQDASKTGLEIPEIPRATLSDDSLILTYDLKPDQKIIWLVTRDYRLAREYAYRRAYFYGTDKRTFVLPPKWWLLARAEMSRFSESEYDRKLQRSIKIPSSPAPTGRESKLSVCQRANVPPLTEENMVFDTGAVDVAFERIRAVVVGQHLPPELNHLPDGSLNPQRNRLRIYSVEPAEVLPYQEYFEPNDTPIVEFHQLKDAHLEQIVRYAEISVPRETLALPR